MKTRYFFISELMLPWFLVLLKYSGDIVKVFVGEKRTQEILFELIDYYFLFIGSRSGHRQNIKL